MGEDEQSEITERQRRDVAMRDARREEYKVIYSYTFIYTNLFYYNHE